MSGNEERALDAIDDALQLLEDSGMAIISGQDVKLVLSRARARRQADLKLKALWLEELQELRPLRRTSGPL